ncbi:hypothetical protein [Streptomyces sp. MAR4 CNX-425]|uniref:hypothetical protein n=1 Tax=Streptomyces sp. MAR4 CNX-425 TaxID=3406343 RepID=UPI003B503591
MPNPSDHESFSLSPANRVVGLVTGAVSVIPVFLAAFWMTWEWSGPGPARQGEETAGLGLALLGFCAAGSLAAAFVLNALFVPAGSRGPRTWLKQLGYLWLPVGVCGVAVAVTSLTS